MSADHWRVIHAVRSFYLDTGVSPSMRALVRLVRERIGAEIGSSLALLCLFLRECRPKGCQDRRAGAAGQVSLETLSTRNP